MKKIKANKIAMNNSQSNALIVVDVQNGFTPGGQLAVQDADQIIELINQLMHGFEHVILTQDWHPVDHISFANQHPDKAAFDQIELDYGQQVLWPSHCVQGTLDAEFHPLLNTDKARLIIRKGIHKNIDSYSAFTEADGVTTTGLAGYLIALGIKKVYVVGIATDFCVSWTALDARAAGFDCAVIEDACKEIDLNGSLAAAWQQMQARGVDRILSHDVFQVLKNN